MRHKRLYCRGFLVKRGRGTAAAVLLVALTFLGTRRPAGAKGADKLPCWDIDRGPQGEELCRWVGHARELLSRLRPETAEHLRKIATEFELERNLRIQQALFREDLNWLNRGYTKRQIDVMVFVAVALSLESAADLSSELVRATRSDPKAKRRLEAVRQYRRQAADLLERLWQKLGDLEEQELKFYF